MRQFMPQMSFIYGLAQKTSGIVLLGLLGLVIPVSRFTGNRCRILR